MGTDRINTSKNQIMVLLLCGLMLLWIYGRNIAKINTVWELGDEASYLWNTAYFLQMNWDEVGAAYPYSGYGYSLILIPVFLLCKSGVSLIRGACIVNIVCLFLMYILHISILRKVSKNSNSILLPMFAFISCCTPYLASNVYKVLAEVFLSFWYSLIILIFLYAVSTKKKALYFLLGSCSAFMLMIHTRAVMVFISLCLFFLLLSIKKGKEKIYYFIFFLIGFIGLVFILYLIKYNIVQQRAFLNKLIFDNHSNEGNLLTLTYILNRLKDLFVINNIANYMACFLGKVLYVIWATAALIPFYFIKIVQKILSFFKTEEAFKDNDEYTVFVVELFVMINLLVTLVACTVNGPGSDVRYTFYGRYYEYVLPILICMSINHFVREKLSLKMTLVFMIVYSVMGVFVLDRQLHYLQNQEFWIDTNRLSALTKLITKCETLPQLIYSIILFCILLMGVYVVISFDSYSRLLVVPLVGIILWMNSSLCIEEIISINEKSLGDTEIAEYILEKDDENAVYMVDDNSYKYPYYYSRMQILLKDIHLQVITQDDMDAVKDESYVVVYTSTDLKDTILKEYNFLKEGHAFLLYQK